MDKNFTFELMERLAAEQNLKPLRKRPSHEEHDIQVACVRWFRLSYPHLAKNLFAIPNGGWRNEAVAAKLKAEGVTAGVFDLELLVARNDCNALFLDTKTKVGRLSDKQKEWAEAVKKHGYKCVVFRSLDEFIHIIENYLASNFKEIDFL
jgi:hypothetical protein